jgi:hypothetical protein
MASIGVSSVALNELLKDLSQLSVSLHEVYELMHADMRQVNSAWQDGKYEQFVQGYKPQIDKCEEISVRYKDWCNKVLTPEHDRVVEVEKTDVSGGNASSGGGMSSTDTATMVGVGTAGAIGLGGLGYAAMRSSGGVSKNFNMSGNSAAKHDSVYYGGMSSAQAKWEEKHQMSLDTQNYYIDEKGNAVRKTAGAESAVNGAVPQDASGRRIVPRPGKKNTGVGSNEQVNPQVSAKQNVNGAESEPNDKTGNFNQNGDTEKIPDASGRRIVPRPGKNGNGGVSNTPAESQRLGVDETGTTSKELGSVDEKVANTSQSGISKEHTDGSINQGRQVESSNKIDTEYDKNHNSNEKRNFGNGFDGNSESNVSGKPSASGINPTPFPDVKPVENGTPSETPQVPVSSVGEGPSGNTTINETVINNTTINSYTENNTVVNNTIVNNTTVNNAEVNNTAVNNTTVNNTAVNNVTENNIIENNVTENNILKNSVGTDNMLKESKAPEIPNTPFPDVKNNRESASPGIPYTPFPDVNGEGKTNKESASPGIPYTPFPDPEPDSPRQNIASGFNMGGRGNRQVSSRPRPVRGNVISIRENPRGRENGTIVEGKPSRSMIANENVNPETDSPRQQNPSVKENRSNRRPPKRRKDRFGR